MKREAFFYALLGIMSGIIVLFCAFVGAFIYPMKYKKQIVSAAEKYNLSPSLVASIIYTESHFDKRAISKKGAVGLMQLMPSTASSFCDKDDFSEDMLLDPEINIELGCKYLSYLFDKYHDCVTVLACYNAGETQARAWRGQDKVLDLEKVTFPETKNYIEKVLKIKNVYKNKF